VKVYVHSNQSLSTLFSVSHFLLLLLPVVISCRSLGITAITSASLANHKLVNHSIYRHCCWCFLCHLRYCI